MVEGWGASRRVVVQGRHTTVLLFRLCHFLQLAPHPYHLRDLLLRAQCRRDFTPVVRWPPPV